MCFVKAKLEFVFCKAKLEFVFWKSETRFAKLKLKLFFAKVKLMLAKLSKENSKRLTLESKALKFALGTLQKKTLRKIFFAA